RGLAAGPRPVTRRCLGFPVHCFPVHCSAAYSPPAGSLPVRHPADGRYCFPSAEYSYYRSTLLSPSSIRQDPQRLRLVRSPPENEAIKCKFRKLSLIVLIKSHRYVLLISLERFQRFDLKTQAWSSGRV